MLDALGLAPAIEELAGQTSEHYPIKIAVDVRAIAGRRFPEAVETALFRIVQEALQNIVKHSAASRASIGARREGGGVVLEVVDNGRGFSLAQRKGNGPGHLGLLGMRERAVLLKGQFTIDSSPGRGTRIAASIPVAESAGPARPWGDAMGAGTR